MGHPVTVGQSPAYESHSEQSETETRKTAFCSSETLKSYAGDWPTVTGCPVSNPGYNCANGQIFVDGIICSPDPVYTIPSENWKLYEFELDQRNECCVHCVVVVQVSLKIQATVFTMTRRIILQTM